MDQWIYDPDQWIYDPDQWIFSRTPFYNVKPSLKIQLMTSCWPSTIILTKSRAYILLITIFQNPPLP